MNLSYFDKIGGSVTMQQMIPIFYKKAQEDDHLKVIFQGYDMKKLVSCFVSFFSMVLGATTKWKGNTVKDIHKDLDISEEAY